MSSLVSLVLPVYNQGDHIAEVTENYLRVLADIPTRLELILVTNGCVDDSEQMCRALSERHENVHTINLVRGGWGRAVKSGLKEAQGDIIGYTNVARTRAEDLSLMILYAMSHRDRVIKANRKIRDSLFRRFGSLLYNLECRMLFDLPYWDINGTPKVFPCEFSKLLNLSCNDDLIDLEFNVICRKEEYPMIEVPTLSPYRIGGRSTTNVRTAVKLYFGALKMWWQNRG